MMMNCTTDKAGCNTTRCLKIGLMVVAGVAALSVVVMLLWNCLIPDLFPGAQPVSYLQALGILVLSKILFGGFRGGCHGRWKEHRQRWESMTPEEREQMKSQFKSRWGRCGSSQPDDAAK